MNENVILNEKTLKEISKQYAIAMGESIRNKYDFNLVFSEDVALKSEDIIKIAESRRRERGKATLALVMKRVAITILAIGISLGALCMFSEDVRAIVVNWYRELIGDHIIYHFEGEDDGQPIKAPTFGWIPEGFIQKDTYQDDSRYDTWFFDNFGNSITFGCYRIGTSDITELISSEDNLEKIIINNIECDFYQTLDETEASVLIWQDDNNNVVCELGATLERDEIIKIAENICFDVTSD